MGFFQRLIRKINTAIHTRRGIDLMASMYNDETGIPFENGYWYESSAELPELKKLLKTIKPHKQEAIIDLGCGKGATLLLFKKAGFGTVEGVELSDKLVDIARRNMQILNKDIFIHHADAALFMDFDRFTHVYFFNPFPEKVMRCVAQHLTASLLREDRPLMVIYYNPTCHSVLMESGVFRLDKAILASDQRHWIYTYLHTPENGISLSNFKS